MALKQKEDGKTKADTYFKTEWLRLKSKKALRPKA